MLRTQNLNQLQKGIVAILGTSLLTYLAGGFFGWIESKFYSDFGSSWIGTPESIRYIFGVLIAPAFFLALSLYLLTTREDRTLRVVLLVLLIIVVLINAAVGLSTIIFSGVLIALGYASAKFLLYLKSILSKNTP